MKDNIRALLFNLNQIGKEERITMLGAALHTVYQVSSCSHRQSFDQLAKVILDAVEDHYRTNSTSPLVYPTRHQYPPKPSQTALEQERERNRLRAMLVDIAASISFEAGRLQVEAAKHI